MKANKLTSGSNLMWESSRMMLPEHIQGIQQHQKEIQKRRKPIIDDQEAERFSILFMDAIKHKQRIRVELFHSYHDCFVTGMIEKFEAEKRQIKIRNQAETIWIRFEEIIGIDEFPDEEATVF